MLGTLGRAVDRHPWVVILLWVAGIVVASAAAFGGLFGQPLFDRLVSGPGVPGQTAEGIALLDQLPQDTGDTVTLLLDRVSITSPELKRAFGQARTELQARDDVLTVKDPLAARSVYEPGSLPFLAGDQRAVAMVVTLKPGLPDEPQAMGQVTDRLQQVAGQVPGSRAYVGGETQIFDEVTEQVETDLRKGEGVALPISLGIMIIVFGGFLAALMPVLGAIAAIAGGMGILLGFSYLLVLDSSVVNVVTVMGLGLCIDYGLLLVSRYREELGRLHAGPSRPRSGERHRHALDATMRSAGRTILFSGITVAISLAGLMVFQAHFLRAIGAAGVSVVAVAVLVALTLVPALLSVTGERMIRRGLIHHVPVLRGVVTALGDVSREHGAFFRLARLVQRFPIIAALIVLSGLVVASLPVLRLELIASGSALLPRQNEQRALFDNLAARFPGLAPPTVQVLADATPAQAKPFAAQLKRLPAVLFVSDPQYRGDAGPIKVTVIDVRMAGSAQSPIARQVVRDIRAVHPGFQTWTIGETSGLIDFLDDLKQRSALAFAIIILTTFVLLFLMTGSVLIPLKALLMNVVSLGASLGVLVWVFQDGNLEGLLKFSSAGGIETFIPPLALAFGFGLAMDYEVFLLSRVAEYRRKGYPNNTAVALGLQRSGRIITSAALIIVVVFSGFVTGQLLVIKETGVALAVAVAVDATLVRMLLVPATMTLLGEWNWWAPPLLRRLHDRYGVQEGVQGQD